jgi:hypothetical protein
MQACEKLRALEKALLAAHASDDHRELVKLYWEAGQMKEETGDIDAACFYYTHAYVFALETGDPASANILGKLVEHGRDAFPSNC